MKIPLRIAVLSAVALAATPIATDEKPQIEEPTKEVVVSTVAPIEQLNTPTVYTIHGITPNREWQKALRTELKRYGIEWYMPYAVCQIFQESRWNQYADNGKDKGICQMKEIYWFGRAKRYGVRGASIWDVNAQFRVFAGMMSGYLKATGNDIGWALSYYFYGNGQRADKYVHDVLSHLDYLKEVK